MVSVKLILKLLIVLKTKIIHSAVGIWLFLLTAGICFGWGDTFEEIQSAAGTIKSIQAQFRQEKHMRMLVRPLVSEGSLTYLAPGSLRWEYHHPIKNVLLMHAGRTKRFVKTDAGWGEDASPNLQGMQVVMEQISQWFAGHFDNNTLFKAVLDPGTKITLTPKESGMADMIQRVELMLSSQAGVMEAVLIYEDNDSYTRLIFLNPVINESVAPSAFDPVQ